MNDISPKVAQQDVEDLRGRVRGAVYCAGDTGYDSVRAIWNGMINRRPALIVQCLGTADVMAAVNFARDRALPLAIRAGGHSVAGNGLCDDGLVIDLTRLDGVRVDPAARLARVGGGARWADLDHEAQAFGLACTGGVVSSTGVAGLTLGGGIGYLTRSHGLACDNLLSADVVTATGELVHASARDNPDLLWALRGGGGNFGVVTSLEFQLHPVGPMVAAAVVFHGMAGARDVLAGYRDYALAAPDQVACYAMFVNAPADLPAEYQGQPVLALVACYSGDVEEGVRLLQPLSGLGAPIAALMDPMPYQVLQTLFDAGNPKGERYYWKSQHLMELPDALLDVLVEFAGDLHGSRTIIGIEPLGGAHARVAPGDTAFVHRSVAFSLGIWTGWSDPAQDRANIGWTRAFFDAVRPFGAGTYVNYLGEDDGGRIGEAYGDNLDRLSELKRRWDPDNLFSTNQNIAP